MILMRLLKQESCKKKKGRDSDVNANYEKKEKVLEKKGLSIMRKIRY